MSAARAEGRYKFFIYTKPEAAPKFSALGFRELAASKNSVLMEWRRARRERIPRPCSKRNARRTARGPGPPS